jgi:hypothetical protein
LTNDRTAPSKFERRTGLITLALVGGLDTLFALAGGLTDGARNARSSC